MVQQRDRMNGEQVHAAVALFAALVAVSLGCLGFLRRYGFTDNSPIEWAKFVGLSWFLLFFSLVVRKFLAAVSASPRRGVWTSHATLTLAALTLAALLGIEWGTTSSDELRSAALAGVYSTILFGIGAAGFLLACWSVVRSAPVRDIAALVVVAGLFSIYAAGASYGNGFQNPLFVEGLCFDNIMIDGLFHMSVSNMLRTHGIPSTGLDGVPFIPFHFGSHWLFAQLCNLLDVGVADLYSRGYRVIFAPFSVFCLGTFAATLVQGSLRAAVVRGLEPNNGSVQTDGIADRAQSHAASLSDSDSRWPIGLLFWLTVWTGYIGFMPYRPLRTQIYAWSYNIVSESYSLAVSVSLLGLAWGWLAFQDMRDRHFRWSYQIAPAALFLAGLMAAIHLLKISQVAVLIATFGFFFLRLQWYRSPALIVLFAAAFAGACSVLRLTLDPAFQGLASSSMALGFWRTWVDPDLWSYFWLFSYAWLWIVAALRLREEGIRTLGDLADALRGRRLLDVELLFVVAIVGAVPGMLNSYLAAQYFAEYHQWVAIGILLSMVIRRRSHLGQTLPEGSVVTGRDMSPRVNWSAVGNITVARLFFMAVIVTAAFFTPLFNTFIVAAWMAHNDAACRGHSGGGMGVNEALRHGRLGQAAEILKQTAVEVERRLDSDKNVLQILRCLDELPRSEKRASLLYIPASNVQFWKLIHGSWWPLENPLVAPALSGVAMIDGLNLSLKGETFLYYGFNHYARPDAGYQQPPLEQYLPVLRSRCANRGFKQLIVIDNAGDGRSRQTKYPCP